MTNEKETAIRHKAYEIWEKAGRPHGRQEEHWHQATTEVGKAGVMTPGMPSPKPVTPPAPVSPAAKAPPPLQPPKPMKAAAAMATPSPVKRKK